MNTHRARFLSVIPPRRPEISMSQEEADGRARPAPRALGGRGLVSLFSAAVIALSLLPQAMRTHRAQRRQPPDLVIQEHLDRLRDGDHGALLYRPGHLRTHLPGGVHAARRHH
jgi:hypothetical protein